MIKFNDQEVQVLEVDGATATVKRSDGFCFNSGSTIKIVPTEQLYDDSHGSEIELKLRGIRSKQQQEDYKK